MFYENKEFRRISNIMTEWRGKNKKLVPRFHGGLRRKSDVVPVTRYFHAITAFFFPVTSSHDHVRRKKNYILYKYTVELRTILSN